MDNLTPDQIHQMISLLQSMLPKEEAETKQTTNRSNKSKKPSRDNKFNDMMEKNMHKEDVELDKKLSIHPPVPRTRHFKGIDVQCRICGKRERVNPALIPESVERYKCNKCSITPG